MDRNSLLMIDVMNGIRSPPARVAWIEIPRKTPTQRKPMVATREGGVDRNKTCLMIHTSADVATREGGVDRNKTCLMIHTSADTSPPARVAWIEILQRGQTSGISPSPPARVAWIEIVLL